MPKRNRPRGRIRAKVSAEPADLSDIPNMEGGEVCEVCGQPAKVLAATRTKAGPVSFPVCSEICAGEEADRLANLPDIGMETEEQIAALPDTIETVIAEMEAKKTS